MAKVCKNCGKKIAALYVKGDLCSEDCMAAYEAKVREAESENGPYAYKNMLEKEGGLTLEFEISMDDISDFNLYHHSPSLRTGLWMQRLIIPFLLFLFFVVISEIIDAKLHVKVFGWLLLAWLAFTTLWIVYLGPRSMRRQLKNRLTKMYGEGQKKGYAGKHKLSLTRDVIIDSSTTGESKNPWKAVEKIVVTDKHALIYVSAASAHIIPERVFPDELNFRAFVAALRRYHKSRIAAPVQEPFPKGSADKAFPTLYD